MHPGVLNSARDYSYPPWGILNIASSCRQAGFEVLVADLNGEPIEERIPALFEEFRPTAVGITAKLGNGARRMRRVVDTLAELGDVPIGIGGPLVSSFPDPEHPLWRSASALFLGDGEKMFPEWVAAGCPPAGLVGPAEVASLDCVGIPSWWPGLGEYVSDAEFWPGLRRRALHVSAARGCTRRCTFCYLNEHYPGRKLRKVSPARILEGCDELHAAWGAEGFYFVDDCLLRIGEPETDELLARLVARGSPYRFGCDLQLQELEDLEFLDRLHEAGFRSLYVGVESASAAVRKRLGKGSVASEPALILRRALDRGFVLRASIGLGWPEESADEMAETIRMVESLPDLMFDAFRYTPLPGAPLTRFWRRKIEQSGETPPELSPFEDYSELSENHSLAPAEMADALWEEFQDLESERHRSYFRALAGITPPPAGEPAMEHSSGIEALA